MATLSTLYPTSDTQVGTWTTDANGTTNLWQKIEEGISTATDTNDFIRAPTGATNTTANQYEAGFTDTPSDFVSMTTLSVNVRYNQTGRVDDTLSLVVRIESSGGTAYTDNVTISNITTTTFTNSGATAFTLTSAGLAATKSDWDSAYIALSQTYSASMGSDNARVQVSAIELTGEYSQPAGATATPSTILSSATLPATTQTISGTRLVDTIATPATLPAPSVSFGSTVTVSTISVTATITGTAQGVDPVAEPTLGTGTLGGFTIGRTAGSESSATALPATILLTTTMPAVTVSAGAITSPNTTQMVVTLPSTAQSVSMTASVDAILAAVIDVAVAASSTNNRFVEYWGLRNTMVPVVSATTTPSTVSVVATIPSVTVTGNTLLIDTAGSNSSTTSSSSMTVDSGITWQQGDLIVVGIAADNAVTSPPGGASLSSVSDDKGHSYTLNTNNYDPGAASAGITCGIAYATVGSGGMISTDKITISFSPNTTSKAAVVFRIRPQSGYTVAVNGIGGSGTGSASGTMSESGTATNQDIRILFAALEGNNAVSKPFSVPAPSGTEDATFSDPFTSVANTGTSDTSAQIVGVWNRRERPTETGTTYNYYQVDSGSADYAHSFIQLRPTAV